MADAPWNEETQRQFAEAFKTRDPRKIAEAIMVVFNDEANPSLMLAIMFMGMLETTAKIYQYKTLETLNAKLNDVAYIGDARAILDTAMQRMKEGNDPW